MTMHDNVAHGQHGPVWMVTSKRNSTTVITPLRSEEEFEQWLLDHSEDAVKAKLPNGDVVYYNR